MPYLTTRQGLLHSLMHKYLFRIINKKRFLASKMEPLAIIQSGHERQENRTKSEINYFQSFPYILLR